MTAAQTFHLLSRLKAVERSLELRKALLGRIVGIAPVEGADDRWQVTCIPLCVLPHQTAPPDWLKDQKLTIERVAADPRALGVPGDSLVLDTHESARWLNPLRLSVPSLVDAFPQTLGIELSWWKDDKAPDYVVRCLGREWRGSLEKGDDKMSACVDLSDLAALVDVPPAEIVITVESLTARVVLTPAAPTWWERRSTPDDELLRLQGDWYTVDLHPAAFAGGITQVTERARGRDLFVRPEQIQGVYDYGGIHHGLRHGWNWLQSMFDRPMESVHGAADGDGLRLTLEGLIDEGMGLRSTLEVRLLRDAPLVLMNRQYHCQPAAPASDKPGKPAPVKMPIDDLKAFQPILEACWQSDQSGSTGSRLHTVENGRYVTLRPSPDDEHGQWARERRMSDGWALVEHPLRAECAMLLFDPCALPTRWVGMHHDRLTVQCNWSAQLVERGRGIAHSAAWCFGEWCGASEQGVWVACRCPESAGQQQVAIVARWRKDVPDASVWIGEEPVTAAWRVLTLPGVGEVRVVRIDAPKALWDGIRPLRVGWPE